MKYILAILTVFMLSGLPHAAELTIGLIPEQNVFNQVARYKPVGEYIEKKTGIKIKFTILSRYGNIIESFYKKKLDGAFWGSFTGAMAIKKLDIQLIARPVNLDGTSSYHGYIFVRKDSGIIDISDMKGKTIAFVDKATTAGYVFPIAHFKVHGIKNINTHFKEYYFTGSHDAAIHAVLDKKAHIGCAKNTIFELLAKDDRRVKEDLVILAKSPNVPSNGLGIRKEIAYGVKAELQRVLINMDKDPEGQEVLNEFGAIRFIETTESDYSPVIEIAQKAGVDLKNYNYINK
ncbi:MAG: phosphate/phosphite/phosphonate ABC transporter substrate-binding protein [Thermodesulfovibrionia bacterium]|nr:phosphate/phosphite/phosphonate ABC transporter substrate-binding protein [Thermodesulfovibrionia bacterium]MCK5511701.1 phosphate/phosphite/phosphonate ABC transporter substrate-binding protein [Thermodesulfovibrionia bacterium]